MPTVSVTGGNLFDLANRLLGDAQLWYTIASANGIADPWLDGLVSLQVPSVADLSEVDIVSS